MSDRSTILPGRALEYALTDLDKRLGVANRRIRWHSTIPDVSDGGPVLLAHTGKIGDPVPPGWNPVASLPMDPGRWVLYASVGLLPIRMGDATSFGLVSWDCRIVVNGATVMSAAITTLFGNAYKPITIPQHIAATSVLAEATMVDVDVRVSVDDPSFGYLTSLDAVNVRVTGVPG